MYCDSDSTPTVLVRSPSIVAFNTIPIGLAVLFVMGGWMYMEGRKEEVGDEVQEVQGIAG